MDPALLLGLGLGALPCTALALAWRRAAARAAALETDRSSCRAQADALRERWTRLCEQGADLAVSYDTEGLVTRVSPAGLRLLGREAHAALRVRDLFDARFLPLLLPARGSDETRLDRFEIMATGANGAAIWLDAVADFAADGAVELLAREIPDHRVPGSASAPADLIRAIVETAASDAGFRGALGELGRGLDMDYVELWRIDPAWDVLRCDEVWCVGDALLGPFAERTRQATFRRGVGLAGRTWAVDAPQECRSLESTADPLLRKLRERAGVGGALALPVHLGGHIRGVLVMMTRGALPASLPPLQLIEPLAALVVQLAARERDQEALRVSEERKLLLVETALDCVITIDAEGTILEWNPAAEETFGHARANVLGRSLARLIIPESRREAHERGLSRYLETGQEVMSGRRIEVDALRADGDEFPAEMSIVPIHTGQGPPVFTAYVRDITEAKELDRLKDELMNTANHELRTPLASIRGFVELLLGREHSAEDQRKYLGVIHTEAERLTKLVNDFLDVQRIEAGAADYELVDLDLAELVPYSVDVCAAGAARHRFEVKVPDDPLRVHADRDRISQVVLNLCSNAVKFSPQDSTVHVTLTGDPDQARVTIRDEGVGMSEATLEKLFQKFYRGENPEARKVQGTGLGLVLVKQIVNDHGGNVSVRSTPDEGSEFEFTLPLSDGKAVAG